MIDLRFVCFVSFSMLHPCHRTPFVTVPPPSPYPSHYKMCLFCLVLFVCLVCFRFFFNAAPVSPYRVCHRTAAVSLPLIIKFVCFVLFGSFGLFSFLLQCCNRVTVPRLSPYRRRVLTPPIIKSLSVCFVVCFLISGTSSTYRQQLTGYRRHRFHELARHWRAYYFWGLGTFSWLGTFSRICPSESRMCPSELRKSRMCRGV